MKRVPLLIYGLVILLLATSTPVFADDDEISRLKDQINKLTKRINELEDQIRERPSNIVPKTGEAPSGNLLETAVSGLKLSGFVDTGWHWNFNNPSNGAVAPTGTREQSMRIFDQDEGSFTLHAVEVALERPAPATGGVGFRTDLYYGEDAEVITPSGSVIDEFDIQQAYVEARLPLNFLQGSTMLGDSLYLRAGKYVTLAGAEVIEAKDNWNITRSFLFGFAIPFTHTGVRAVYDLWGGKVSATVGLNNGWDNVEDNNDYSTFEGQLAFKPNEDILLTLTTYMGPENFAQDGHKRYLLDIVALWHVTDKLSVMANVDFGNERRVVTEKDLDYENAQWHGYALYARYQLTEKAALAWRGEIFVDDDIFRVGGGSIVPAGEPLEFRYFAMTYTGEYKLYDNLISRLEVRHDWSDAPIFNGESSQATLSAQLIYNFA